MGRVIAADLRIDGSGREERVQIVVIQQLHVLLEVALHTADACHIVRILVGLYIKLAKLRHDNVTHKEGTSLNVSIVYDIDQKLTADNEDIHGQFLYAVGLRIDVNFLKPSVFHIKGIVEDPVIGRIVQQFLRNLLLVVGDRHIRTAVDMGLQHGTEIKVHHHIRIGHDHIFLFLIPQEVQKVCQCAGASYIRTAYFLLCKRREDAQTAVLADQIPFTAGTQMIH